MAPPPRAKAPAPPPKPKTIDQCLHEFDKCLHDVPTPKTASAPAPAAAQARAGPENVTAIRNILNQIHPKCTDVNTRSATWYDQAGLLIVPPTATCPTGTAQTPGDGGVAKFGKKICLPPNLPPPPQDIQVAGRACDLGLALRTIDTRPSWVPAGYKMIDPASLPTNFILRAGQAGLPWVGVQGRIVLNNTYSPLILSPVPAQPTETFNLSGARLTRLNSSIGYIRHSGMQLLANPPVANNYDFTWQFLLKDGTANEVIIWNPYPGNGAGIGVQTVGPDIKIAAGTPTVYALFNAAPGSRTSGYAMAGILGGALPAESGTPMWVFIIAIAATILALILALKKSS